MSARSGRIVAYELRGLDANDAEIAGVTPDDEDEGEAVGPALPSAQGPPPKARDLSVHLVAQDVGGFNILRHDGLWIAVAPSEGAFTRKRLLNRDFENAFVADTEGRLKAALKEGHRSRYHISRAALPAGAAPPRVAPAPRTPDRSPDVPVRLVEEDVDGFNVLRHDGLWIAVSQREGTVTRRRLLERDFKLAFVANTEREVKSALRVGPGSPCHISRAPLPPGAVAPTRITPLEAPPDGGPEVSVHLVEQDVDGFNILRHDGLWIAVAQSEGAFTRERLLRRAFAHAFVAGTASELRSAIAEGRQSPHHVSRAALPPGADPPIGPPLASGPAASAGASIGTPGRMSTSQMRSRLASDLALAFHHDRQVVHALKWFKRALEADPANQVARLGRVRALLEDGQLGLAIDDLTVLVKATPKGDPGRVSLLVTRGWANFRFRRWAGACHDFTAALLRGGVGSAPERVALRRGRAWAAWRAGRRHAALRDFMRLERLSGVAAVPRTRARRLRTGLRFRWFVLEGWLVSSIPIRRPDLVAAGPAPGVQGLRGTRPAGAGRQ